MTEVRDRQAAEAYARSVAGDDQELYVRLFLAAYNIAADVADGDGPGRSAVASTVLGSVTKSHSASRALPMASPETVPDGPGGSVLDDPVYVENSAYVIPDNTRILGGVATSDFPDCVAVGTESGWCCSGTLIAPQVVVTAAHCHHPDGCSRRVFFGDDIRHPERGRVVSVATAVAHENYVGGGAPFDDITVLVLEAAVDGIAPRPIADPQTINGAISVQLVGFGTTDPAGSTGYGERRVVEVPLASPAPAYGVRPETEFVAGRPFLERDSCPGDSGGPAYVEQDGSLVLAGATSRGTLSATVYRKCGDGGIYTHVPAYADWIRETVA